MSLANLFTKSSRIALISRSIHSSSVLMGKFEVAQERVKQLNEDPGNDVKLQLYALFKQATIGECNAKKPGAFDFVGKAKWGAWKELGSMGKDKAENEYIGLVEKLVEADSGAAEETTATSASSSSKYETLLIDKRNKVFSITLNRPQRKNALSLQSYKDVTEALKEAAEDKDTTVCTITGAGDFYCSGNDLAAFAQIDPANAKEEAIAAGHILRAFVASFIDMPKPLIALVNGPTIGVAATTLGLCDLVYASSKATFHTPIVELGQTLEGCSSYTFPKIMGYQKANEMLLACKKINAVDAEKWGLVSEVFPAETFKEECAEKVKQLASMPKESMMLSKQLIKNSSREELHKVNIKECDTLAERWQSEEFMVTIMNFFSKKSKI